MKTSVSQWADDMGGMSNCEKQKISSRNKRIGAKHNTISMNSSSVSSPP